MDSIRRTNPRKQGEIGLANAIAWFVSNGYVVSVPLADNQAYDLIVDDGERLSRVQVKTATGRAPSGAFCVWLRTSGGNQSRTTTKPFSWESIDFLFVLTDDGSSYLIPAGVSEVSAQLVLNAAWDLHRVTAARGAG